MKFGFIGLGKMGGQMVARLLKAGHQVVVLDHHQVNIDAAIKVGAESAASREQLVQKLASPAIVWLMIPASAVEDEVSALLKLLPKGSIIIDGGNSDFRITRKLAQSCSQAGIELLDVGTSGGILGASQGYSLMVGGEHRAFEVVEPIVKALAQGKGYHHFGPSGAGHYVKMVHNAVEYGVMEAYAEGYRLLEEGRDYPGLDLAKVAEVWQNGSIISSKLNGLVAEILKTNPGLQGVEGFVSESGEARWTLEAAKVQGVQLPAVESALEARLASHKGQVNFGTKLLAALRNAFGGHSLNGEK